MTPIQQEMITVKQAVCEVPIAGIQPLTTIDFPGKITAVFFTKGCPWECRYCHNPELRKNGSDDSMSSGSIEEFLRKRAGFLDGIVMSGGEPTIHSALPDFLQWIREFGYVTAIHTNGYFPKMLRRVIKKGLVDYVAMDVKAPPAVYDRVTCAQDSGIAVARSIELILSSGVEYEFRTTYHPDILSEQELMDTIHAVSAVGAKRYYIQRFRTRGVTDRELVKSGEIVTIPEAVINEARKLFEVFEVR